MNKNEVAKVENGVVRVDNEALPAFLRDRIAEDAGKGISTKAEDNTIPLIYVLQSNSPQVNKRGPDYIEGAEAGYIWLRNLGIPPINGEEGMIFQPCSFQKDWVEWKPNRAGFADRHLNRPAEAVEKNIDPQHPKRLSWVLPNGNVVQETRYHIGYVHLPDGKKIPFVIPMASTGHTTSKEWMLRMSIKSMPGVEGAAPSWSCLYRLTTRFTSNEYGEWFAWHIEDAGWVSTDDDYLRGKALYDSIQAGEKAVETPEPEVNRESNSNAM